MYKLLISIFISIYFLNKLIITKEDFEYFEEWINQGYPDFFNIKNYLKNF